VSVLVLHVNITCARLPHVLGMPFTGSAYCQFRWPYSKPLLRRLVASCELLTDGCGLRYSHRTRLVDGTGVSMPDTPELQRAFGQPTTRPPAAGSRSP
jgi:hypothetical protein